MKTKQNLLLILLSICLTPLFAQVTISDVSLPAMQVIENQKLVLNGGGLREKLWIDLYVSGLYLSEKVSDAKTVINGEGPMNMHIEIVSSLITREKFLDAVNEGFEKTTNGNISKFEEQINDFKNAFKDEIIKGDKIDIFYSTEKGMVIKKNGKIVKTIQGLEFKKVLFGIWFGEKPADKKLKAGMLGN